MIEALRALKPEGLKAFTEDLKSAVLERVEDKIAHLESSMAVAELTVAVHYVLNTPEDILIWDVGHQGYFHKAITGRLEELRNMRKPGGISGFLKRSESPFDFFGAGHASTSISALSGVCAADKLSNRARHRVAIIGDGSLTGGQSFEALNFIGAQAYDAVVIINDNEGSIDATVGALHEHQSYKGYVESLGWSYTFLEEGNDVEKAVEVFNKVLRGSGPRVLHVKTTRPDLSHEKSYKPGTTFQWYAAEALRDVLTKYWDLQLISPAMFAGSGFAPLKYAFEDQMIDTGINEAHAVTMAAGIAATGGRPWVHIYSTFLQRAYDQVVHDIVLQKLPVVFLVDRAGVVGADGSTHHGFYDSGFLSDLPGVIVWNPMDGTELQSMIREAADMVLTGPLFIRYPKSTTVCGKAEPFEAWRWLQKSQMTKGKTDEEEEGYVGYDLPGLGADLEGVLFVTTGELSSYWKNHPVGDHIHLAQIHPIPEDALKEMLGKKLLVVMEETAGYGSIGGTISMLVATSQMEKRFSTRVVVKRIPDRIVDHGDRSLLLKELGLIP
ncbi:MAG: hypothetical protein RL754_415 [Bacteroidota bacterium]